jgi:hypothetical protein
VTTEKIDKNRLNNPLLLGLSLIGGTGVVLMIVALGLGVAQTDADAPLLGGLVLLGLFMLIGGVAGWAIVVRPAANFDDINVPKDIHTHTDDHAHDSHAIVVAEPHAVEPHGAHHS